MHRAVEFIEGFGALKLLRDGFDRAKLANAHQEAEMRVQQRRVVRLERLDGRANRPDVLIHALVDLERGHVAL